MANSVSPDGAERYETQLEAASGHTLAEQGAGPDPDRKKREQQCDDRLIPAEDLFGEIRELRQKRRPIKPKPRDPEDR